MKEKVETIEQFTKLVKENQKFILLKHSLTCPISQEAYDEFDQFCESNKDCNAYYLYVQEARPLSNYIAETYGIKHESPQALIFENDSVKWHASHFKITEKSLTEASK